MTENTDIDLLLVEHAMLRLLAEEVASGMQTDEHRAACVTAAEKLLIAVPERPLRS